MQRPATSSIWIVLVNLPAFVAFVASRCGHDIIADEMQAIVFGVRATNAEADEWYDYTFAGQLLVQLSLATDPGSDVLWWSVRCPEELREAIDIAAGIMQEYHLVGGAWKLPPR